MKLFQLLPEKIVHLTCNWPGSCKAEERKSKMPPLFQRKDLMPPLPTTSTTLLRDLGNDATSARWTTFVTRYEPMMRAYLQAHFPRLDADDILQETFIALINVLPRYHYNPSEHGHFHNYLTGILRKRALQACRTQDNYQKQLADYASESSVRVASTPDIKSDILEIALQQLLADDKLSAQSKQVFIAVAVNGEAPAAVAERFHITRNNVDQIKQRLTQRLRDLAQALETLL